MLLTCGNAVAGRRLARTDMTCGGWFVLCDGFCDTPLTCADIGVVSSDASLNHWM